ncbi:hypothetical protein HPB50_028024 [Hyalomma asiaticum]|nr:hypothetical protein HPB50_028024 [Hyalomma asiaticum]
MVRVLLCGSEWRARMASGESGESMLEHVKTKLVVAFLLLFLLVRHVTREGRCAAPRLLEESSTQGKTCSRSGLPDTMIAFGYNRAMPALRQARSTQLPG